MDIVLPTNLLIEDKSPISACTGYKAKSLIMKKDDIKELRLLALRDFRRFNTVMAQLEGRFK